MSFMYCMRSKLQFTYDPISQLIAKIIDCGSPNNAQQWKQKTRKCGFYLIQTEKNIVIILNRNK